MQRSTAGRSRDSVVRVRGYLVAALHSGRLKPGDRIPSVRRLSDLLELDRKTVHRAYRKLGSEGLLEMRSGSGTFVSETRAPTMGQPAASQLVLAVNRCRAEAAGLGLSPAQFARFLGVHLADGLRDLPLAITECNQEQVGLFGLELRQNLGIQPRPALLADLRERPREILGSARGIVSTDFHRKEVQDLVAPFGVPVYLVSLEPSVPRLLVEHAERGPLIMVVFDRTFAPDFLRFLAELDVPSEVRGRFRIVEPREAPGAFRSAREGGAVYVSPLAEKAMEGRVPERFHRLLVRRHLAAASVERLRVRIALDVALASSKP